MYAIIGEDDSDVETLSVIVRRLAQDDRLKIRAHGYGSCGELLHKGAAQLSVVQKLGFRRVIVCHDSDRNDPSEIRRKVIERVVRPANLTVFVAGQPLHTDPCCCVLVPIQEIEAWILADIQAVSHVFSSWKPGEFSQNPESVVDPKEELERLSRAENRKPIYTHAVHNRLVAKHLDLGKVRKRCPSFGPLVDFVLN